MADVVQFVALLYELQKDGGILGVRFKRTSVIFVGLLKSNIATQSTGRYIYHSLMRSTKNYSGVRSKEK